MGVVTVHCPVVPVTIGVGPVVADHLREYGYIVPTDTITIRALVDTGAGASCIDRTAFGRLWSSTAAPEGASLGTTTTGGHRFVRTVENMYDAAISLEGKRHTFPSVLLVTRDLRTDAPYLLEEYGAEAIIGWDILQFCVLRLDGPGHRFTIDIPKQPPEHVTTIRFAEATA